MAEHLRVHVAGVGQDPPERILIPLVQSRADRAYLITRQKDDLPVTKMLDEVKTSLSEKIPACEVRLVRMDIWDLESQLKECKNIFQREKGNHISVNVSTGTGVANIAGMLACMLWGGTPYYALMDYPGNPTSVKEVVELPVYTVRQPEPHLVTILKLLQDGGGRLSKKQLIDAMKGDKALMPDYGRMFHDEEKKMPYSTSASHSKLKVYLRPLESEWGFVKSESRGRNGRVELTEAGKQALRIFG